MKIRLIHENPENPLAKEFVKCLKGSFDAIEKKYVSYD